MVRRTIRLVQVVRELNSAFGQNRTDNSELFAKTVMKSIIAACLLIASNVALADPPANGCGKFASTDIVSAPMTIAEVERQEMDRLS